VTPEPADGHPNDPGVSVPLWRRWYIEARSAEPAPPWSCSFVEFDERGDYLDFWQHRHAYQKIIELGRTGQPLTVVMYVHGWRHSGQSHDVIAFNEFLAQLSAAHVDRPRRIHGVYLAWRGAALKHIITPDAAYAHVREAYGEDIVDFESRSRVPLLTSALETLSYFDRKSVPEYKFSGTAVSRTLFSCAYAAKRNAPDCESLLIGHSFGGLLLERTFQNAEISALTQAWSWGNPKSVTHTINPLPFDTVLIVNSAAPSIYAKQFQSYLAAHRQAMLDAKVAHADVPIVFSVTSVADWATGVTHPIANSLCFLVPTLRRRYSGSDFTLVRDTGNSARVQIPQSYYYRHTPGHNPLIVNRFIEPSGPPAPSARDRWTTVRGNLMSPSSDLSFVTTAPGGKQVLRWSIKFPPDEPANISFSKYRGHLPVAWTKVGDKYRYRETAYWIVRCPKEIISGHNDIWSQPAMDTYAALHRIALQARDTAKAAGP
jgi:hypothetical protein